MVRDDQIRGYGHLLDWAAERGALAEAEAERLREEAAADADARRRALGRAWSFRRALHDCLRAVARREPPPEATVALHQCRHRRSAPMLRARAKGRRHRVHDTCRPLSRPAAPGAPLRPAPACRHPTSPGSANVPRERCGKLYLDHTKNGSRRWCDMETCGNRAKARPPPGEAPSPLAVNQPLQHRREHDQQAAGCE